jgi:hypothetical protein
VSNELSTELRDLLSRRVDSFEKVELVMALRAAPHSTLTVEELSTRTRIPRDVVRSMVVELRAANLVERADRDSVQLVLPSGVDEASIAELEATYASDPIRVMKFLSEIAMNRIRSMASRAFADAFIFGKKKGDRDDDA